MRIIGSIPHPVLKITVFQLNMKFAVKFEAGMMEQTYKIRESDSINKLSDIDMLVDDQFKDQVLEQFKEMAKILGDAYQRLN
ncbi:MAG: hypothetical protein KDD32_06985 [Bacteroidetes bacterium]|nr:hypothetical protein [Bacteroidota bacterium]